MGFIYIIHCKCRSKKYIGQTVETAIEKRWKDHRNNGKIMIKSKTDPNFDFENMHYNQIKGCILYKAMAKHGVENFYMEQLVEVEFMYLNETEIDYISYYNSLIPNGYNTREGGSSKYHHSEYSINLMKETKKERLENVRDNILLGCPQYLSYQKVHSGGPYIRIQKHPLCKEKSFYVKKYGTIEAARDAACVFLVELEKTNIVYEKDKKGGLDLPKGMKETPKGYKIEKYHKGKCYHGGFESSKFTREENKQLALKHYNENIKPLLK
jgi:hypothetical protein